MKRKNRFILEECNHKFHVKCIMKWFRSGKKSCPMCRKEPEKKSSSETIQELLGLLNVSNTPMIIQNMILGQNEHQLTFLSILKCICVVISGSRLRNQLAILVSVLSVAIFAIIISLCLIGSCFIIKTYVFILNAYVAVIS